MVLCAYQGWPCKFRMAAKSRTPQPKTHLLYNPVVKYLKIRDMLKVVSVTGDEHQVLAPPAVQYRLAVIFFLILYKKYIRKILYHLL